MIKQALPKIETYTNVDGKFVKVENEVELNVVMDSLKASYLRGNPFNYRKETSLIKVYSIEDYLINVGKQEFSFGDAIRSKNISNRKRKKIVKKSFKTWDKDYLGQKKQVFNESKKSIGVIEDLAYPRVKIPIKIIILILLVLLFFMNGRSRIWDQIKYSNVGNYLYTIVDQANHQYSWLKVVVNCTIYLLFTLMLYSSFFSYYSKNFVKKYTMAESFLKDSKAVISKNYKSKYRNARKYYLKAINNPKIPYFPPLDIVQVEEGDISIEVFKEASQSTIDRAFRFKKVRPLLIFVKNLLLIPALVGGIIVIGLLIYKMILSIFLNVKEYTKG